MQVCRNCPCASVNLANAVLVFKYDTLFNTPPLFLLLLLEDKCRFHAVSLFLFLFLPVAYADVLLSFYMFLQCVASHPDTRMLFLNGNVSHVKFFLRASIWYLLFDI